MIDVNNDGSIEKHEMKEFIMNLLALEDINLHGKHKGDLSKGLNLTSAKAKPLPLTEAEKNRKFADIKLNRVD